MEHQHRVLRVTDGVGHLIRGETHVHRMQHRTQHRDGEEKLQIPVAVPVEDSDPRSRSDAGVGENAGRLFHPLYPGRVG